MDEKKDQDTNYDEWLQKIHEVSDKNAAQKKHPHLDHKKEQGKEETSSSFNKNTLITAAIVFFVALITRLVYIFIFTNPQAPGWYTDVFHHWQIAYLSKEIGFSNGFLRLWDFKGMEYFWGLLHPLVLAIIFTITGSTNVVILRLLSTIGGSISIALLFLLIKRHFNFQAALATAVFAVFFPISLFSNTSGMQEELAVPLILTGFLLWPKKPIVIGILFALASMVRAEYWLFSIGLVLSSFLLFKNYRDKAFFVLLSYLVIIFFYMKYLASWTGGDYIYPIHWNFLANAQGAWAQNLPIIGEKLLAKHISQGIFFFGAIGAILTLIKKPKYSLLFLFGFGNIVFIGFMLGFSEYVRGYFGRFWLDRLYNWPYIFTAILAIILLFYIIPKKLPLFDKLKLNWLIFFAALAFSQIIWKPINFYMSFQSMENVNNGERQIAREIASVYKGGTVLLPEDRQVIVYFLANDFKINGKNMEGQMYDPFFYFPNKADPFSNWGKDRKIVLNWLKRDDIRLIALTANKGTYEGLIQREPKLFKKLPADHVLLYEVQLDKIN